MLIFDKFPSSLKAETFAEHVRLKHGLSASVFDSQEESNKVDIFPFALNPPIVLVERADGKTEVTVENLVVAFDGTFAGT